MNKDSLHIIGSNLAASNAEAVNANSWSQQIKRAFRSGSQLLEFLQISPSELDASLQAEQDFPCLVTPHYASLMKTGDAGDPLLREVLPIAQEKDRQPVHFSLDPLREKTFASDGIVQKYQSRVLLHLLAACPIHCRYCFRRHHQLEGGLLRNDWQSSIRNLDSDVREVILSGGDPLVLNDNQLAEIIATIAENESITTLRIHTRMPVAAPQRLTDALLQILTQHRLHTVLVVHCNHENALDPLSRERLVALKHSGATLLNQSVLLRGVNDSHSALVALSRRLMDCGVLPYYLHMLDPVSGAAHFAVPRAEAEALMHSISGELPGYLVPNLVVEEPGAKSKTRLV